MYRTLNCIFRNVYHVATYIMQLRSSIQNMHKAQNYHNLKFICIVHFQQVGIFSFALKPFRLMLFIVCFILLFLISFCNSHVQFVFPENTEYATITGVGRNKNLSTNPQNELTAIC